MSAAGDTTEVHCNAGDLSTVHASAATPPPAPPPTRLADSAPTPSQTREREDAREGAERSGELLGTGEHRGLGRLDFDKSGGLLPAIVQDANTGAVLMLGYMNREALEETLSRRRVVFFSRSKGRLWEKGEASGNALAVAKVRADCDGDTLLILARPQGPTCHRGTATCFGDDRFTAVDSLSIFRDLEHVIAQRMLLRPQGSYTTSLFESGIKRIAQKVGEEGLEVALAAVGGSEREVIAEYADLVFHLLVLLRARGLELDEVVRELRARHVKERKEPAQFPISKDPDGHF
jgi:phosphoribosyl-ATP pyrophosphohydrolase/phosphoribosyl-AMP cyclohydrolase